MLARKRDRDVKAVQLAGLIKDRDGGVLTGTRTTKEEGKKYLELRNEGNKRRDLTAANQEVAEIAKGDARKASKWIKSREVCL